MYKKSSKFSFRHRGYKCVVCSAQTMLFGNDDDTALVCPTCGGAAEKKWDNLVRSETDVSPYPANVEIPVEIPQPAPAPAAEEPAPVVEPVPVEQPAVAEPVAPIKAPAEAPAAAECGVCESCQASELPVEPPPAA